MSWDFRRFRTRSPLLSALRTLSVAAAVASAALVSGMAGSRASPHPPSLEPAPETALDGSWTPAEHRDFVAYLNRLVDADDRTRGKVHVVDLSQPERESILASATAVAAGLMPADEAELDPRTLSIATLLSHMSFGQARRNEAPRLDAAGYVCVAVGEPLDEDKHYIASVLSRVPEDLARGLRIPDSVDDADLHRFLLAHETMHCVSGMSLLDLRSFLGELMRHALCEAMGRHAEDVADAAIRDGEAGASGLDLAVARACAPAFGHDDGTPNPEDWVAPVDGAFLDLIPEDALDEAMAALPDGYFENFLERLADVGAAILGLQRDALDGTGTMADLIAYIADLRDLRLPFAVGRQPDGAVLKLLSHDTGDSLRYLLDRPEVVAGHPRFGRMGVSEIADLARAIVHATMPGPWDFRRIQDFSWLLRESLAEGAPMPVREDDVLRTVQEKFLSSLRRNVSSSEWTAAK